MDTLRNRRAALAAVIGAGLAFLSLTRRRSVGSDDADVPQSLGRDGFLRLLWDEEINPGVEAYWIDHTILAAERDADPLSPTWRRSCIGCSVLGYLGRN